jgi:uncharacterized protein (TIGR03437 family)
MRAAVFFLAATLAVAGQFSTSLGDANPYTISAIATDSAGNTYVVGSRQLGTATTYIGIVGVVSDTTIVESAAATTDVFVSKLDPNGKLLFTDIFGGKGVDTGTAIAVDPTGNIYIAGTTTSPDFPLSKAFQTQPAIYGGGTAFIMKLSGDGSTILYSTYFGGTQGSSGISALATDANGNLYLTGSSVAADYPVTQGMPNGSISFTQEPPVSGAIIAKISAAGDKILYSGTIAGHATICPYEGSSCELSDSFTAGSGIALDAAGNAYVAGNTDTIDLPITAGAFSTSGVGGFVAKINAAGTGLGYVTYLSSGAMHIESPYVSTPSDTLNAIAVDAAGNAYIGGASSGGLPTTSGALQTSLRSTVSGNTNGFLAKLNPSGTALVWATYLGGAPEDNIQSIAVDGIGDVWATGTTKSTAFPNANGWTTGPEFLVELNSTGSKLTYSALYPSGTVAQSVALDPTGPVHVAGSSGFVSAIAPNTGPAMSIFVFQNVFGGSVTARISPGEVISIYGPGIGPATPVTATPTNGLYPTTLGGIQVAIGDAYMPLLYVSANQINAVLPMGTAANAAAIVHVDGPSPGPPYSVWVLASAAQALPTVFNQDHTVNSQANPAKGGSIVTFYGTGWESDFYPLADGQVATTAQNVCQVSSMVPPPPPPAPDQGIGPGVLCQVIPAPGVYAPSATVLYAGPAPGIVAGVTQFNIQIGPVAMSNFAFQMNFSVTETASIMQTVWVAY